jgi:hypothetical protein
VTLHRMPEGLMSEEASAAASAERDARERVEAETEKVVDWLTWRGVRARDVHRLAKWAGLDAPRRRVVDGQVSPELVAFAEGLFR